MVKTMLRAAKSKGIIGYVLALLVLALLLGVLSEIVLQSLGSRAQAWRPIVFGISMVLLFAFGIPLILRRQKSAPTDEKHSR